jgi:tetratricopeptide (TPR) repeat protein
MLNHLGQHDQAVQVLEDTEFMIFEHDPADLIPYPKIFRESYLGLARMALREKNYIQAWAAVEKCLNMERRYEENCAEIYFYAGLIQEKRGDFQKALIFYERILAENISKEDKANYQFRVKAAHRIVKLNWIGIK